MKKEVLIDCLSSHSNRLLFSYQDVSGGSHTVNIQLEVTVNNGVEAHCYVVQYEVVC